MGLGSEDPDLLVHSKILVRTVTVCISLDKSGYQVNIFLISPCCGYSLEVPLLKQLTSTCAYTFASN